MPAFSPTRLAERLPEANAHVLHGVVLVHLQVAAGGDGQVEGGVFGQQGQHVVEKADAGGDPRLADAVQQQFQFDVGFRRLAVDAGSSGHRSVRSDQSRDRWSRVRSGLLSRGLIHNRLSASPNTHQSRRPCPR